MMPLSIQIFNISRQKLLLLLVVTSACSGIKDSPKYRLSNGRYDFKQAGEGYKKAFVTVVEDSVKIFLDAQPSEIFAPEPLKDQFFIKHSFDVDVMTILFKYRPITDGLPRQLTTDFNGNIFIGYRLDRFRLRFKETPAGVIKLNRHRGLSFGAFGGVGSTEVTPSTTGNRISDEYNGLILTRGLALMVGVNNLTVGIGLGWDYLTDRDKGIWIYQNRPWYGLTLGLNLN